MTEETTKKTIFPVRGTVVLLSLVLPLYIWSYALLPDEGYADFNYYLMDVISLIAFQLTAAVLMLLWVKYWKVDVMHMWHKFDSKHVSKAFQLTLIQLLFSLTSVFVLFYLLSLYFPDFITSLLELAPQLVIYLNGEYNLLLNTLYF